MKIETDFLERCVATLAHANAALAQLSPTDGIEYELYRSAAIKEFEIILEQSGKLLKKVLSPFFASKKQADRLYFKDIFRAAHKHGLLTEVEVERWLNYRDLRNATSHEYGEDLAEELLPELSQFIKDAEKIIILIKSQNATS